MHSNLLRAALAQQGMTQGKLAELVGISPNSLSRKRNGKRQFTLGEVEAISRVLELQNPAAVFFLTVNPKYATSRRPNPCHFPNWNRKPSSLTTRKEHEQ